MRDTEQKTAAKAFYEYWKDKGYEKGESQPFWLELLQNVLGVENPAHYIKFEEQVHLDHTRVLIYLTLNISYKNNYVYLFRGKC